jgi:hypothetical protein
MQNRLWRRRAAAMPGKRRNTHVADTAARLKLLHAIVIAFEKIAWAEAAGHDCKQYVGEAKAALREAQALVEQVYPEPYGGK